MKAGAILTGLAALMLVGMFQKSPIDGADAARDGVSSPSPPARADDERVTVSVARAQCRADPSAAAGSIVQLKRGARLDVLERRDDWMRVSPTGDDCWVEESQVDGTTMTDAAPSTLLAPSGGNAAPVHRRSSARRSRPGVAAYGDGSCSCGSGNICIGPRGGRYCITSGGNKRYGM